MGWIMCQSGYDNADEGNYGLQRGLQWLLKIFAKSVSLVNTHNVARGIKTPLASQPAPAGPFEYLMMDFIEINPLWETETLSGDG